MMFRRSASLRVLPTTPLVGPALTHNELHAVEAKEDVKERSSYPWFPRRLQQISTQVTIALGCLALGVGLAVWRGPLPFESVVRAFARIDAVNNAPGSLAVTTATLRRYYGLTLAAGFTTLGVLGLLAIAWTRLSVASQKLAWRIAATLACSCALCIYISKLQWEHIPIDVLMDNPGAEPIFGHRLLFVWIAKAYRMVLPTSSYLRSYYASQVLATVLTLFAVGRWSALYVGESLSWLGQILAVVMISTCFGYRNFYDIGIVFFFTCGLLAVYRRRYWWLPLLILLGTLNHENILLLIFTATFLIFDEEPPKVWVPVILVSLLTYVGVRVALQSQIPFHRHVDWRIWSNMVKPFTMPREIAYSVLALGGWYVLALMTLQDCDKRTKRLLVLFPMLFGVTFCFGQFHEPRQFNAFIPVLIAVLLSRSRLAAPGLRSPIPNAPLHVSQPQDIKKDIPGRSTVKVA